MGWGWPSNFLDRVAASGFTGVIAKTWKRIEGKPRGSWGRRVAEGEVRGPDCVGLRRRLGRCWLRLEVKWSHGTVLSRGAGVEFVVRAQVVT